ncbi:MAG TPA: Rieske 2Fe-2S domain-containing protein [Thermoanaerobaculia bacterium]|jgi:Rieske Fe-S protein|nr:Rieske 2Fe-2S domain-containing protein [Thermoanaerobaculia bacterium]
MASERLTEPRAGTRRGFLAGFVAAAAALFAGTLSAIAARFLGGDRRVVRLDPVAIGPEAAFTGPGPVEAVLAYARPDAYRSEQRRERIFVVREAGGLAALSSTCTHLGCSVRWDPGSRLFRCPCHGGTYRPDGTVAGGPPPAPLARLPIEIRAGQVWVRPTEIA